MAIDLITHSYPLVNNLVLIDGIRMAGKVDIAAMRLNAIVGDGSRLKEFIDIVFLSSHPGGLQEHRVKPG